MAMACASGRSASYDGAVIAVLMEGTAVTLRTGSVGSWTAVTYGGRNGFVYADYLTTARNPSIPAPVPGSAAPISPGSNAQVTDTLNFRSAAELFGRRRRGRGHRHRRARDRLAQQRVLSGAHGAALPAICTATISATPRPRSRPPVRTVAPAATPGAERAAEPGARTGQSMVDYAMRYLGYPYVWATHGPSSFDCSGFTYWVVLNVLGRDIGAGTWTQWGTGSPIQYGNLQPGDLVFFQNTYTVGLSHVGMYIGNDQFIHAENENTGVRISSLTSTYYSTRYLGARRYA